MKLHRQTRGSREFEAAFDLDVPCGPNCLKDTKPARRICGEGRPYLEHETRYYVELDVKFNWWRENYGADADGNRGVMTDMTEIDGWTVTKLERYTDDGPMLTLNYDALPADEKALVESLIEHELRDWQPDDGYDDYDGPDTIEEARGEW